ASEDGQTCSPSGGSVAAVNFAGTRPDLLVQLENGIGGTTYLDYRPSTQWDNTDASGVPRLPFVNWTLTGIEQDDGMCGSSTSCISSGAHALITDLRYGFGLFNATAREFRGFATVEQRDGAGTVRTSWFHQDAARKGKVSGATVSDAGGNIMV